jgi:hypothetical protein
VEFNGLKCCGYWNPAVFLAKGAIRLLCVSGNGLPTNGHFRGHWSFVTGHSSLVSGHLSLVIGHWLLVIGIGHWLLVIGHLSLVIGN